MNPELLSKSDYTITDYFNEKTHEYINQILESEDHSHLTRKQARKIARNIVRNQVGYTFGDLGSSNFSNIPSRRERRRLAKDQGIDFQPIYNN